MDAYLKLYRWAMQMKLRMGIYTLSLLVCKMVWNWIQGIDSVKSVDILTAWGACILFAIAETVIIPQGKEHSMVRTLLWIASAHLIYCGGAFIAGWFQGISLGGGVILLLFLEFGLAAMWFGDNVAMRADSAQLNRQLKVFQRRQNNESDITQSQ